MCDKFILEIGGILMFVPDCYKNQNICKKAADIYHHALGFVSDCYKTHKICDKAVKTYSSTIQFVLD